MSIVSVVEILYWIVVKPFGLAKKTCNNCTHHHYPSPTHKWITRYIHRLAPAALFIFTGYRFYLVGNLLVNPPRPEETKNQITDRTATGVLIDNFMSLF